MKFFHSQNKNEGVPFYIIAGQSNVGRSRVSEMTGPQAALYDITFTDVFIKKYIPDYLAEEFEPLDIGTNTRLLNYANTDEFGMEASLFKALQDYNPIPRYLFKDGDGGTTLAVRWLPPSGIDWGYFNDFINTSVAAANAEGIKLNLKAFIWMQGEEDAVTLAYAEAYQANLQTFMDEFNTVWAAKCTENGFPLVTNCRKIIGQIDGASDPVQIYEEDVRSAQAAFCAIPGNNATLIDTRAYPLSGDGVHINATGQIAFGLDIFDIIKDL